jgi:hypothetical protein
MNSSDRSAPPATMQRAVEGLLETIRSRFYPAAGPLDRTALRRFHRDRRLLLYALTWPAAWLERRALTCPPGRYRRLIDERLAAIAAHGDPARYAPCFPRYLLKCLQDFFEHHGDELYEELKHIRNALDQVLANARLAQRVREDARQLDILVATHRLLHAGCSARPGLSLSKGVVSGDPGQLRLF